MADQSTMAAAAAAAPGGRETGCDGRTGGRRKKKQQEKKSRNSDRMPPRHVMFDVTGHADQGSDMSTADSGPRGSSSSSSSSNTLRPESAPSLCQAHIHTNTCARPTDRRAVAGSARVTESPGGRVYRSIGSAYGKYATLSLPNPPPPEKKTTNPVVAPHLSPLLHPTPKKSLQPHKHHLTR